MKRRISLLVSILLLSAVIYFSDVTKVFTSLKSANLTIVGLAIGVWTGAALLRTLRWNALLKHVNIELPLREVGSIFLSGFYISNITPARAGDAIRPVFLKRQHGESFSQALPSVIVERILDIIVMMSFTAVGLLLLPAAVPRTYTYLLAFLFGGGITVIIYTITSRKRTEWLLKLFHRILSFIPNVDSFEDKLESAATDITDSFTEYRDRDLLVKTGAVTVLIWLLEGVMMLLAFQSIGIQIPYLWAVIAVPLGTLIGVISMLPGGVGSTEAFMVLFFVTLGEMSSGQAAAAVIIGRAVAYWMYIIVGSVTLARMERL